MKLGIMGVGFGKGVRIDEDLIRHAESLGFDSVWTAGAKRHVDTMLIGAGQCEALELLAETLL